MSPNCECGHERGDHGPKMWGCAYCPCTAYEARPPESTDSFNSGSYTDSFTPEVETRPIITRIDFFGTEYVPKAAWVEAQSSLDAMRLQLDSACQYRDRYKAERDEARDKRFFWENACRRAEGVMVQEAQAKHEALWQLMEATGPVSRETVEKATRAAAVAWVSATNANDVMAYANTSLFSQVVRAAISADRARLREAMPDWDEIDGPDTLALFDRACAAVDEKARESAPHDRPRPSGRAGADRGGTSAHTGGGG